MSGPLSPAARRRSVCAVERRRFSSYASAPLMRDRRLVHRVIVNARPAPAGEAA
jgi:hypothetical protein